MIAIIFGLRLINDECLYGMKDDQFFRSRHDRNQRGGIEDDDCLLGDNEELSYNPTGDPLLDAKMLQVKTCPILCWKHEMFNYSILCF